MAIRTEFGRDTDPPRCREGGTENRTERFQIPQQSCNGDLSLTSAAREYRTKRVKDARTEAQKEIEEYRKQKDEEFKKFEAEQTSGNKKAEEDSKEDADNKVEEIKSAGGKMGDKVVEDLLRVVTEVKPEVPERVAAPPKA
ncbi:hypothetical protein MMC24_004957 [Lignoscripta atroalba]|nr:hypothetical protein [Lignoscripta atroalba]